ncbi:unnamed protein product [Meganyctiphanes norvegica]|uniref:SET domain-containing protein n=1 Tax=Meganyctiphanes norvegica TaxID=48144 RepID=A0AAV2RQM2_MEGNR
MSLVVHKLVLNPGGGATSNTQPTHHVTLAAYTAHTRSNVLSSVGRPVEGLASNAMNNSSHYTTHSSSSSSTSSSSSSSSSRHILPFVLQDHNYGAPPPPTPPQSPPPATPPVTAANLSYNNHHTYHSTSNNHHPSRHHSTQHHQTSSSHQLQTYHPQSHHQAHHNAHHSSSSSSSSSSSNHQPHHGISHSISSSSSSINNNRILPNLSSLPLHRQQFMPHPKTSIFPSPHIPPPPVELHQLSPNSGPGLSTTTTTTKSDNDSRLSDRSSSVGPSGEETETAPEGEGDEQDDSITRCVCDFTHDDGYMIQCDRCFVWQHVDCMEIDRNNIPDEYLCEACEPRSIDRLKARALQIRRRQEIKAHLARLSSSDSDDNMPAIKNRSASKQPEQKKVLKKKKVKTTKESKKTSKGSSTPLKKNSPTLLCGTNNNVLSSGFEEKERKVVFKSRRRKSSSMSGTEVVSDDSSSGLMERLRTWVEGYEEAVTNHYSPELRARVHAARINGVSADLKASTHGAVLGHRCRVMENPVPLFDVFDSKILIAATRLQANTALIEFQGKYLLSSQWNAHHSHGATQPFMPYVLQYYMPKEGLTVCVDARTYGNDARFARRSCNPNAEIRHVVERGSLHLYLVARQDIQESQEITIPMDTANSQLDLMCCSPLSHNCPASRSAVSPTSGNSIPLHKRNGLVSNKKSAKKYPLPVQQRTRTTSTDSREASSNMIATPSSPVTPIKQRRTSGASKSPAKSPGNASSSSSSPEDSGKDSSGGNHSTTPGTPDASKVSDKNRKMTREERKILAIEKAFERMEKAAMRRQEMEKKKTEDKGKDKEDKRKKSECMSMTDDDKSSADECGRLTPGQDRSRRRGKKGKGKGTPQKRVNRPDSTASDLTGDESSCPGMMSPAGSSSAPTMEGIALTFTSPNIAQNTGGSFRFPKTKKALMNEWMNETVDPVLPTSSGTAEFVPGVQECYMRSPATILRRSVSAAPIVPGAPVPSVCSAKKRWLRQAISEENPATEHMQLNGICSSPSRPDSPSAGGDYITPLKKRRMARESMSSEQSSTPPSTPVHSNSVEEDKTIEELTTWVEMAGKHKSQQCLDSYTNEWPFIERSHLGNNHR